MRAARVSALLTLAALASGSLLVAQPAAALEPGVHVDPHSPAAKEYALPVNQARGTNGAGKGSEDSSETLFGAGIKPPSSGSSGGSAPGRAGSPRRQPARSPATTASAAPTSPPPLVQRVADARASSGGGASASVLLAGGVAILVLGAFAGIVLRHSRRPDTAA